MHVKKTDLLVILTRFVEDKIVPQLNGWEAAVARGGMGLANYKANAIVNNPFLIQQAKTFGLLTPEDTIDMEALRVFSLGMLDKDGLMPVIPHINLQLEKSDVEALFTIASDYQIKQEEKNEPQNVR